MKRVFVSLVMTLTLSTGLFSQTFNSIPMNREISQLSNGWYKFKLDGAVFDVEVEFGKYKKGNISWFDGSTYSGDLNGVHISGKGSYTWPDGSQYQGSFRRHQRHGKGSQIAKDGSKWSGKWKNDQKNGKGTTFDTNGAILQYGVWGAGQLLEK
ncbi:hypothetical protein L0P88_22510 [Muricauda sp. SCSIO 64092]|uniref:hypothetical protein n=1 Tax=Allomuricauda sp. SCSIO 64092 TaxID=2908842 RepID=UPI001FF17DAC|nr:hypothetical protein [Muricauda sp. SCSIO 64092]UOY06682.1 hypothetical protein L0P88_22510 [Muricauda sp. SCSIO 64092]